jgi:DNA-directed RNA polymerase specialized sigma24 family protein
MEIDENNQRLNLLATSATLVREALHGADADRRDAQGKLLERYGGAVRRYLQASTRDAEAADELFQEFALRLCQGNLSGFDPERGRFRDYVKGVLLHLVLNYHGQRRKQPGPLPTEHPGPEVGPPSLLDVERAFLTSWRDELLARSWSLLAQSDQTFYSVLRFRADHPDMPSARMAVELAAQLGRPLTSAGVRQTLRRGRDRFSQFLVEEVRQSLASPTPEHLEQELSQLGLLEYCQSALQQ